MLRFVVIAGLLMSGAMVVSVSQLPVRSLAQPNVTTSRAPNADTVDDTLEKLKALVDQHKPPFAYGPAVEPLTPTPCKHESLAKIGQHARNIGEPVDQIEALATAIERNGGCAASVRAGLEGYVKTQDRVRSLH